MTSVARYVVLAATTLAVNAAADESKTQEAAGAEYDAWESVWSFALYEHLAGRGDKSAAASKWDSPSWRRDRSDARAIYGDAWVIYRRARAIYQADREGHIAAALENFRFAEQIVEGARMKYDAAIRVEERARSAAAKAALAIYETGRERNIPAWENYQSVLQKHEDAWMKREAAYKAERAARRAVRDAFSEVRRAARKAIEKANPTGK